MSVWFTKPSSTPYIVPHERMSTARWAAALGLESGGDGCSARIGWRLKITAALKITSFILFITAPFFVQSRRPGAHTGLTCGNRSDPALQRANGLHNQCK